MKRCGIYQIRNLVNGKVYIGSSVNIDKRWTKHKKDLTEDVHHSSHLQKSFNKYGIASFVFELLESVQRNFLIEKEQMYLDAIRSYDRDKGYNICIKAHSPLGLKRSDATKENIRQSKLGTIRGPHTEDTKRKISDAQSGSKGYWYGRDDHPLIGHKHTDTTKQLLAEANYRTVEQYTLQGEFIKEWPSPIIIQQTLGFGKSTIGKCCRGNYKQAFGYKWKYKNN